MSDHSAPAGGVACSWTKFVTLLSITAWRRINTVEFVSFKWITYSYQCTSNAIPVSSSGIMKRQRLLTMCMAACGIKGLIYLESCTCFSEIAHTIIISNTLDALQEQIFSFFIASTQAYITANGKETVFSFIFSYSSSNQMVFLYCYKSFALYHFSGYSWVWHSNLYFGIYKSSSKTCFSYCCFTN